jgi:hypothetical protein
MSEPLEIYEDAARAFESIQTHANTIKESRDAVAEGCILTFLSFLAIEVAEGQLTRAEADELLALVARDLPRKFAAIADNIKRMGSVN